MHKVNRPSTEETKAFYAEAIADRMEDGMAEEAVAAMGTPGEVAEAC